MRRRGFLMNSTVILLLIPLLLLLATYEDASSQIINSQSERTQVERTFDVVSYLELDFQKAMEISGKRAIVAAVDYVATTGNFIDPNYMVNNTLRDLILTSTTYSPVGDSPDIHRIMRDQDLKTWISNVSRMLRKQGYTVEPTPNEIAGNIELTVAPLDAFHVVIKGRIPNITIRDLSGKVVYIGPIPRRGYVYSVIGIQDLEDPFYSAMTGGRYHRSVRACAYAFPKFTPPFTVANGSGASNYSAVVGLFGSDLQYNTTDIWAPNEGYITNLTIEGSPVTTDKVILKDGDMGVLAFGNASSSGGGGTSNWCSVLGHRLNVTIRNNGGSSLTNFQVPIYIDSSHIPDYSTLTTFFNIADSDGDNVPVIKVYDENCNPVNFWVEKWNTADKEALIWANVTIPANSQMTLGIYFDSSGIETLGDPDKVFEFYDDFENWTGWSNYRKGKVSQSSDVAYYEEHSLKKYKNNDPNGGYKLIGKTLGRNIILEGYIYRPSSWGGGAADRIGIEDENYDGYSIVTQHSGNYIRLDKRTGGTASPISSTTTWNPPEDDWYFFRMIIEQSNVIMEVYDKSNSDKYNVGVGYSQRALAADTSYTHFDRVVVHGGYVYYVDSLRIRKYNDPMPTVTSYSTVETKQTPTTTTGNARAYDLQPFISCLQDNRYFAIPGGWSFFERLEGSSQNHNAYVALARSMQDALNYKYGNSYYPIGLVSFMIPNANYDEKLFNLFDTLGITLDDESSADYYFLPHYFHRASKIQGYPVWGISHGTYSGGDLSTVPFYIDYQTAERVFGTYGSNDLVVR